MQDRHGMDIERVPAGRGARSSRLPGHPCGAVGDLPPPLQARVTDLQGSKFEEKMLGSDPVEFFPR